MLSAYFDESGTHGQSPVCVVAGLVAEARQWDRFSIEWSRILENIQVPSFHAADFFMGIKPFDRFDKQEKIRIAIRLTNTIKRRVSYRVWTAIAMEDYRKTLGGDPNEEFAFSMCAFGCASRLRWLAMLKGADYKIPYTFERGGKGSHHAFNGFEKLLAAKGQDLTYRNSSLSKSSRVEALPLQAADMHSYEVYRYFADQILNTGRPRRKSFEQLLTIKDAGGYLFTMEKLQAALEHMRKSPEPAPIEVDFIDLNREIKLERLDYGEQP